MGPWDEKGRRPRRVAVVAYAEYAWDPRVRREAETLAENGYVVDVVALRPRSGRSSSQSAGVHLHEVPLGTHRGSRLRYAYQYAMFFLLSTVFLLRLQFRRGFDVVHIHSLPDFQVFCSLPLKFWHIPVLLDLHEAMPEIIAARFGTSTRAVLPQVAALLERLSARFADHVVAANDGIREAVISRGVAPEHITAVYNGSDPPQQGLSAEEVRHKLGLPPGRLLVHAGGINPERDLETLLRAVAQLPSDANTCLVIAGDGDAGYLRALGKLVYALGIASRVMFVGKLSVGEARALMALSEVGVVTLEANPLTELAWPTRVPEFAGLNKPLVVPQLRFLQSVLQDGAQYYAPGDASSLARMIDGILRDPEKSNRAVAKARQICRRFDWSAMREILLGIYHSLEAAHAP
jgi:glycosyltransferase involved in cell wall biosynthesis